MRTPPIRVERLPLKYSPYNFGIIQNKEVVDSFASKEDALNQKKDYMKKRKTGENYLDWRYR